MANYVAPSLGDLVTSISRDLHDPGNGAFSSVEVTDLINMGIAEVNNLVPKEYREVIPLVDDQYEYALDPLVNAIFRVEVWRNSDSVMRYFQTVPKVDGAAGTGWQFFNGSVLMPPSMTWDTSLQDSITVYGYKDRGPMYDDTLDFFDGDLNDEMILRSFCQHTSFERLIASRALFQQWQTQANNADVSATQLIQMGAMYSGEWRSLRARVRRMRRAD